ncbi:UNVERIFIED_CONTAM: putative leucine-rich repeat receptor-like serine/threonine-protein kinase [Sesamum angustifolium]|uniref:non-specific serine/threonine protein kinase n=1 Tax=Sesamum angustifolium TaxID=2727405 RepID=A0AAW2PWW9_9LAMI
MAGITYDPGNSLESWNASDIPLCKWAGVVCEMNRNRVVELNLSHKSLHGSISPALFNLSELNVLDLSGNFLQGRIPAELGSLYQLRGLSLSFNLLDGEIPAEVGFLKQLEYLDLGSNKLVGEIPVSLFCNGSASLEYLDLSNNSLSGRILIKSQCELRNLRLPRFSRNKLWGSRIALLTSCSSEDFLLYENLSGTIPPSLGKCINLEILDLSYNRISGTIPSEVADSLPSQLGSCIALEYLNLSYNVLDGQFPAKIGNLPYLKELDVSFNQLSGEIPQSLQASSTLTLLNFSYNNFYGNITNKGAFSSLTVNSFLGNDGLCGSIKGLKDCRRKRARHFLMAILLSLLITPIFCIVGYPLVLRSKFKRQLPISKGKAIIKDDGEAREEIKYPRISRRQLIETEGFSDSSLIGSGRFGHVYKGGDNTRIAVKVLHSKAEGMAYLHHYSPVKVVHCDLKPSNILLDDDMTALVTDFGIARLVKGADGFVDDSASYDSTDGLLCGSIGYIAPEYGMGKHASPQGDVYSFGVLLLEMVTGKRPTDVLFQEGSSLHEWVKSRYPNKLGPIVEEAMVRYAPRDLVPYDRKIWTDVIIELIELGLICTQHNPSTRPTMLDVAHEISLLKQYLCTPSTLLIEQSSTN